MNTDRLKLLRNGILFFFFAFFISKGESQPVAGAKNVIHIRDFGAKPNTKANCTDAFQKAAAYLKANGGTLIIDPGVYIVGRQRQTFSFTAGYSFVDDSILRFRNTVKPIIISGYGATLKAADGLKFGSFNPVTGLKDSIRKEVKRSSSYYAAAFVFIAAIDCESITVKGLTMDGNSGKLIIGPAFDKQGIQAAAIGIGLYKNKQVDIEDCYIHHCALDAITVSWDGLKDTDPIYPHTIKNVKARYNGRQGLSWVGGNNLTVINSEFSSTGKALNKGKYVVSQPCAGIDVEVEGSVIKNGTFINCLFNDNTGPGFFSNGLATGMMILKKCTFIGTTNSGAYPKQPCTFDSCTFVGKVERIGGSPDKSKACSFTNCLFTYDKKMSPSGIVYDKPCEFYDAKNVVFENCQFDAGNVQLPVFNRREIAFINCSFSQESDINFKASAMFKGTTKFLMKGKAKVITMDTSIEGDIIYNNQKVSAVPR